MNEDRRHWISLAERLATPVLKNLFARRPSALVPASSSLRGGREHFPHLEALGRLLIGLAL